MDRLKLTAGLLEPGTVFEEGLVYACAWKFDDRVFLLLYLVFEINAVLLSHLGVVVG